MIPCPILPIPYTALLSSFWNYTARGVKYGHCNIHRAYEQHETYPPSWGEFIVHLLFSEHMIHLPTCIADSTGLTISSNLGLTF